MKIALITAGAAVALVVLGTLVLLVLASLGSSRMRAQYLAERETLRTQGLAAMPEGLDLAAAKRLPPPGRKYVEKLAASTQPGIRIVILKQSGTLRTAPDKPWMPFEAEQVYSFDPPGFVWLARAPVAPGIVLWARDKYVEGRGNMLIRPLGLFTLADAKGPELDQGAALRYWGEVLMFPQVALGPHTAWEALPAGQAGDRKARVSFEHAGLKVGGVVEFDAAGDLAAFHADRYQERDGRYVLLPWSGLLQDWRTVDGVRVPTHWEAVWHQPDGDFTYVRMDILSVHTE